MKSVLVVLSPGFEETEAITIIDLLRRAGIKVITASIADKMVMGAHEVNVEADVLLSESVEQTLDMIVLPGGVPGTPNMHKSTELLELIKKYHMQKKEIAAICAAPTVLNRAGILNKIKVTSYPSEKDSFNNSNYCDDKVVCDGNITTSRGVGTAIEFSLALIKKLAGSEKADEVAKAILYNNPTGAEVA